MPGKRQPAAAKQRKAAAAADAARACLRLAPDVMANIHGHLRFLDRVAFATVFGASCGATRWGRTCRGSSSPARTWGPPRSSPSPTAAAFFARTLRCGTTSCWAPTAGGSPRLTTAAGSASSTRPRATGVQHALPEIITMGVFKPSTNYHWFSVVVRSFLEIRLGGPRPFDSCRWGPEGYGTFSFTAGQMRDIFYRKVVLSSSPRPCSYGAMLILARDFGAPAFATAEHPAWSLAPSRDGVEDAIYHSGQFYSIMLLRRRGGVGSARRGRRRQIHQHSGRAKAAGGRRRRRQLVVPPHVPGGGAGRAADGGDQGVEGHQGAIRRETKWSCSYKVHVLDDGRGQWKETRDIGEAALFVGANNSLCVSTREHPELRAGSVYFTDDEHGQEAPRRHGPYNNYRDDSGNRAVGVYRLGRHRGEDGGARTVDKYPEASSLLIQWCWSIFFEFHIIIPFDEHLWCEIK